MKEGIRELQLKELELLLMFKKICEENDLRYYLLGGTLLGAVRHNGFIPWDDDIDVCMPRSDYDRFIQIVFNHLQTPYILYCPERNPDFRYCWARLSDSSAKVMNYSANIPREEEVWIDIIPLDGWPHNKARQLFHKSKLFFWRALNQVAQYDEIVDQKRKRRLIEKILVDIAAWKIWRKITNYPYCISRICRELRKYKYDDSEWVINYMAAYGFKEYFKKEWFGTGEVLDFEGAKVNAPANWDSVLKTIYDDHYMQLPPEEERDKHNTVIVEI